MLGLPEPPVADLPDEDDDSRPCWKTQAIVNTAAGRPFVWVDDEITETDRVFVSTHHRGQALLHRVDPLVGITDGDFAIIEDWLRKVVSRS